MADYGTLWLIRDAWRGLSGCLASTSSGTSSGTSLSVRPGLIIRQLWLISVIIAHYGTLWLIMAHYGTNYP